MVSSIPECGVVAPRPQNPDNAQKPGGDLPAFFVNGHCRSGFSRELFHIEPLRKARG